MAGHKSRSDRTVTETPSWLGEGRYPDKTRTKGYRNKLGILETKTIILTRKAPKKQHLAATGAYLKKKWHSTEAAGSKSPLVFFKKSYPSFLLKKKASRYSLRLPPNR